jgi:cytochrome c oxidase subunit 3
VFAVYRWQYPKEFHDASLHLNVFIGALNSAILLISSMTLSFAIIAIRKADKGLAIKLIGITILLALVFLVNKVFEWDHKFTVNLYPGSELMLTLKHGYILFFGLYFFMTGLHAVHIIVGLTLLTICLFKVKSGVLNTDRNMLLVNTTLYWHLVDLIWIFLFPLLYLIP